MRSPKSTKPATEAVAKTVEEVKKAETAVQAEVKPAETKTVVKEEAPVEKAQETAPKAGRRKKTEKPVKAEKPELKPEVFVQFQGQSVLEADVINKIKAAYVAEGHRVSSIKTLKVYIKPEDFKAYYVLNEKLSGEVDLF